MSVVAERGLSVSEVLALVERLPEELTRAVFARYGRPLDVPVPAEAPRTKLGSGHSVVGLSIRMPVDVIANDYFVLTGSDEPLVVPGPHFVAALDVLQRARARS